MTRFARMPKKKYLEASSWEDLSQQQQAKQKGTINDEDQKQDGDSKPESKKKKKSKKRNLEIEENVPSEPVSSSKKQKISGSNTSDSNIEIKKDKKKGKFQPKKEEKRTISKDNLKVDINKKVHKGQGMKVKFSSRKEEKLEKQREARRRRRAKRKGITCFHCRQLGHQAAECPLMNQGGTGIGVCYKCGSSDHTTKNCKQKDVEKGGNPFPFAKCFICGDIGHLSSGCPDNPKGLYPKGGGCNICGSVEHLKRDCPEAIKSKKKDGNEKAKSSIKSFKSSKYTSADAEVHSDDEKPCLHKHYHKKNKTVKF